MTAPTTTPKRELSARTSYMLLCVVAAGVLFILELQSEQLVSSLVVLLAGLVGVLAPQRISPLLIVVVFAISRLTHQYLGLGSEWSGSWSLQFPHVVRSAALLAYVAGHYRLMSLTDHLLPPDPRHRAGPSVFQWSTLGWSPQIAQRRRSEKTVAKDEMALLILSLPIFAVLAQVVGIFLSRPWDLAELKPERTRVMLLAWLMGIGMLIAGALADYWRRRRMSRAEALLYLQDCHWLDTRREQRRSQRAFARSAGQRHVPR